MNLAAIAIVIFGGLMVQKGIKFLQNPNMGHKMHMSMLVLEDSKPIKSIENLGDS